MQIAENLRKIRDIKGLSQENIADELGISLRQYSRWETGETSLNIEKIERVSKILEVKPLDLMTFDEKNVFYQSHFKKTTNAGNIINHFPKELKELYESQLKLLKEQNVFLKEQISFLQKQLENKN